MDTTERARLRALCETATPGPWHVDEMDSLTVITNDPGARTTEYVATIECPIDEDGDEDGNPYAADASLVAASRTALPALLDALDATERERDALLAMLRNLLARVHRDGGQHVDAVGLDAATEEADEIIVCDRAELARLRAPRPSAIVLRPVEDVPETDAPLPWDDEDQVLADGDLTALDAVTRERDDARAEVERIMALVDEHAAQEDVYGADACARLAEAIRARGAGGGE